MSVKDEDSKPLFEYLLRRGDDLLILGHRLSEWCGHAPILEEDIALANLALDCIGQANNLLEYAAKVEGRQRSADDLAFLREVVEFRNVLLVEQPNGDFAQTIVRQFFYTSYAQQLYQGLCKSQDEELSALAQKALKELQYHVRHSERWLVRLGDGTEESHQRTQIAIEELWRFSAELFETDSIEEELAKKGLVVRSSDLYAGWLQYVESILSEATLELPKNALMQSGGKTGKHSEHLGHLLSEMQILPRSFPGASW